MSIPTKNPAAAALGALRWKGVSAADRSEQMADVASARLKKISPKRRAEIAKKAGKASAKARKLRAKQKKLSL